MAVLHQPPTLGPVLFVGLLKWRNWDNPWWFLDSFAFGFQVLPLDVLGLEQFPASESFLRAPGGLCHNRDCSEGLSPPLGKPPPTYLL